MSLEILEHSSPSYSPRTYANAKGSALTVAFAVDFTTAGERLTHKAAGDRYVGIPLSEDPIQAARMLYKALRDRNARTLNVAGNGIYTLAKHGWTQNRANEYVHAVLAKVHEHWPISHVRSGGQTGIDIAGIIAAYALGINATALFPNGFIQRQADKIDRNMSEAAIRLQVETGAANLLHPQHQTGTEPQNRPIFVFGSNLAGRHGKGAALHARQVCGAKYGVGVGRTGNAYAIPTKDEQIRRLPLARIAPYVQEFLTYANSHPELEFEVTRIGCGLAGYTDAQIAPMFAGAPGHCQLPEGWR